MECTFEDAVQDAKTEVDEIGQMPKDGWDKRVVMDNFIFLKVTTMQEILSRHIWILTK